MTLQQEQYRAEPTIASRGLPTMATRIQIPQQMLGKLLKTKNYLDRNMHGETSVRAKLIFSNKPMIGTDTKAATTNRTNTAINTLLKATVTIPRKCIPAWSRKRIRNNVVQMRIE